MPEFQPPDVKVKVNFGFLTTTYIFQKYSVPLDICGSLSQLFSSIGV